MIQKILLLPICSQHMFMNNSSVVVLHVPLASSTNGGEWFVKKTKYREP